MKSFVQKVGAPAVRNFGTKMANLAPSMEKSAAEFATKHPGLMGDLTKEAGKNIGKVPKAMAFGATIGGIAGIVKASDHYDRLSKDASTLEDLAIKSGLNKRESELTRFSHNIGASDDIDEMHRAFSNAMKADLRADSLPKVAPKTIDQISAENPQLASSMVMQAKTLMLQESRMQERESLENSAKYAIERSKNEAIKVADALVQAVHVEDHKKAGAERITQGAATEVAAGISIS